MHEKMKKSLLCKKVCMHGPPPRPPSLWPMVVYSIGKIKKHVLKQKITLQYIQQCNTISVSYALNL